MSDDALKHSFPSNLKLELRDSLLQSKKVLLQHRLFLLDQADLLGQLGVLAALESETALQVVLHPTWPLMRSQVSLTCLLRC